MASERVNQSGSAAGGAIRRIRRGARWSSRGWTAHAVFMLTGLFARSAAGDPPVVVPWTDPGYDVVIRRTDAGGAASFSPAQHHPVELRELILGRWEPYAPHADRFAGQYAPGGGFVRLDVVLGGFHNPPGPTAAPDWAPFVYGNDPVYGFVEIDVDGDADTGGEVDAPQYRYLANVARFGGVPAGAAFAQRVAGSAADLDGDFLTPPFIERHGEEFHLALLGGQFALGAVTVVEGDSDGLFEPQEVWDIRGAWFHRAHGFERYSLASGGAVPGEYAPECVLRFAHSVAADATTLSLVFPLNNAAAAALAGANPQPNNHDPSDQASVNEALQDLAASAAFVSIFPSGEPQEALIWGWKDRGPSGFMQPAAWRATALLGVTYDEPGYGFIWTDVWPNPIRGDLDGTNGADAVDEGDIADHIAAHDLDDGLADAAVAIPDFPAAFSVRDLNYDGMVDAMDAALVSAVGDADGDGDIDLADFARLQACAGWSVGVGGSACGMLDLNADGWVGPDDVNWWCHVVSGP